jgi:uncharacterized membrane protein
MARKKKESKSKSIDKEIASNVSEIIDLERSQRKKRTVGERLSDVIAKFCGSMTFVYVHIVWFGFWIIFNDIPSLAFDPFPYTFLTLVVSLEAIFLSTFILISQNHDTQLSERRNHLDLQINMIAEQENTKMLELLRAIAVKVGVDCDPVVDVLLEPINPKRLVKQIVKATDEDGKNGSAETEKSAK